MSRRRLISLVTLIAIVLVIGLLLWSSNPSEDVPKTNALSIFLDEDLTQPYEGQIIWRHANVGRTNYRLWLKNNAPFRLEHLSLVTPNFPINLTLTWDCENYTLEPYEKKQATITGSIPNLADVERIRTFGGRLLIVYYVEVDES